MRISSGHVSVMVEEIAYTTAEAGLGMKTSFLDSEPRRPWITKGSCPVGGYGK